jgi:hypothetical protein
MLILLALFFLTFVLLGALARASARRAFAASVPVLGVASLAFGTWYALGALNLAPYYF